jgi:oligopeptidase A
VCHPATATTDYKKIIILTQPTSPSAKVTAMTNPLLDISSLPRFTEITPEHVMPALSELIAAHRQMLDELLANSPDPKFDSLVAPLEEMDHHLSRVWSPVSHLQGVLGSSEWRDAYNKALPLLTEYATELSQNSKLQQAYAAVDQALTPEATAAEKSVVDQALRDFRLAGVDLPDDKKARFKEIMQGLAASQAAFENNVVDASDSWSLHIEDETELAGLPEPTLERAAAEARKRDRQGLLLTLDYPTYDAVMRHADNAKIRERMYRGWVTRSSDQGENPEWDNSELIETIMALRYEAATLVGFDNYADYSLATKMADSNEEVISFLRELAARSRDAAEKELSQLSEFAQRSLAPWDVSYWLEKYKQKRYSVSNEELRSYFPAQTTVDGLFQLAQRLYGIRIEVQDNVAAWHEDVRYYNVQDETGALIGGFYTDLHARTGKRPGAWVDECVSRKNLNGQATLPVGYLVCNFPPFDDAGRSLLTHDDVVTLFHEFGHMLHHLLTRIDFPSIAGINGVAWDAVELPSQFMEQSRDNCSTSSKAVATQVPRLG